MLMNAFALSELQEKATYGFGYNISLTRSKDDAALHRAVALADARKNLISFIGMYLITHLPFKNKPYYLNEV